MLQTARDLRCEQPRCGSAPFRDAVGASSSGCSTVQACLAAVDHRELQVEAAARDRARPEGESGDSALDQESGDSALIRGNAAPRGKSMNPVTVHSFAEMQRRAARAWNDARRYRCTVTGLILVGDSYGKSVTVH